MANKPKRRRRSGRNFTSLRFGGLLALGSLGSNAAVLNGLQDGSLLTEDLFVMSVDGTWSLDNYTNVLADGPVTCGYAHSDYSATEVQEALQVNLLGPGTKIEQERLRRLVRVVGTFNQGVAGGVQFQTLNDGRPIRTKLNWMINDGFTINQFAFNEGSGALTTGALQNVRGRIYGRWKI